MERLKIKLGSTSAQKFKAVEIGCKYLSLDFTIEKVNAPSGQNEQPVGFDETFAGALNRAKLAIELSPTDYDIAIGIESGIFSINSSAETTTLDIAIIVVITKSGKQIVANTPGFVFPEIYVNTAKELGFEKNTVGQVIAENLGGDKTDPHSILSNGVITRQETLIEGLMIALKQI